MSSVLITNIGKIVSGDIHQPLLDGDTLLLSKGKIEKVGQFEDMPSYVDSKSIDAKGGTVAPGFIDSHQHPGAGEYTPTFGVAMVGWAYGKLRGGVTTIISAGEIHLPGRPTDRVGTKAMAIYFSRSFSSFRPNGVKVHGGALVLTPDLLEEDFKELSESGVWIVAEVCAPSSIPDPKTVAPLTAWARKYGMKVQMHVSGCNITLDDIERVKPHVVCHINGGLCALQPNVVEGLMINKHSFLEVVLNGNPLATNQVIALAKKHDCLGRIIVGSDDPGGLGLSPLGVLSTVLKISALNQVPAEVALAMATGNTAHAYGLNTGVIASGKDADLVVMHAHPDSSARNALDSIEIGDMPMVSTVIIDGNVLIGA